MDDGLGGNLSLLTTVNAEATLEHTAEGLVNGRLYKFAVSAVNIIDEGN